MAMPTTCSAAELFYPEECHVMAQKAEQIRNCREIKPAFSMMHVKACAGLCLVLSENRILVNMWKMCLIISVGLSGV